MGFWSKLGSSLVGGTLADPIKATGDAFDKLFTSDEERAAGAIVMAKIKQEPQKWQHELNKAAIESRNVFLAGWRPALGWVCAVSLGLYFIPQYFMASILWVRLSWSADKLVAFPVGSEAVMELVIALLGMGAIRTVDKHLERRE